MESFLTRLTSLEKIPFKMNVFTAKDIYSLPETSRFQIKDISADNRFLGGWTEAFQIYGEYKNSINYSHDFILTLPDTIDKASLTVYCLMSAESSYDKGHILLDGVEKCTYTTSGSYTHYTNTIVLHGGNNKLTFSYTKDGSGTSYDDSFYILGMICCYR